MTTSLLGKIGKMMAGQSSTPSASARSVAKERLSVILASQRGSELLEGVDMDALQRDVLEVVKVRICFYFARKVKLRHVRIRN
jgi:septum formation topological specificity factor MinE